MLGRLVNQVLTRAEPTYPWGDTLPILESADLRICNLECVLSDVGIPWSATPKVFHFRSDEKNIQVLKAAKIDIVSLANNHILDYEYDALHHMLKVLGQGGISYGGAGQNLAEASKPVIKKVASQTIGFLAFTDNEPGWEAKENKSGVFYLPTRLSDRRVQTFLDQVTKVRETVDFLIISAHWGGNWGYHPPQEHRNLAYALIDSGADLIFGHSAHVFRGIEIYQNRPILYSVGDFIDDYAVDEIERNDESFIFLFEKERDNFGTLTLVPILIDQFQANLASPYRQKEILAKMKRLCKDLGTRVDWDQNREIIKVGL